MKPHVVGIVVAIVLAGIGATVWLLFGSSGGSPVGISSDSGATNAPGATGGLDATGAGPKGGDEVSAGAGSRGVVPRKLPPPPANGESTVVGRIVDMATHAGVPRAVIVLRQAMGEFAVSGESQADGGFVLERVPGVVGARVFVNAAGYGPRILRDVHVPPHDRLDLGSIEVERGTPIRGRILAGLSAPIPGAEVALLEARKPEPDGSESMLQIFRDLRRDDESLEEVSTTADGAFVFPAVAPGSYVIAARKPGHQIRFSPAVTVAAGAASPNVELHLGEAKSFRGIVKDSAGNPIRGASVAALEIIQDEQNWMPKSQKTVTAADGRFAYSTMGSGMIAVVVEATGYSGATQSNLAAGGPDVEIVLEKAARVEGRVFDRATNKGLPGAVVVVFRLDTEIALEETRSGPDGAYLVERGPSGDKVTVFASLAGWTMASILDRKADEEHGLFGLMGKHEFAAGTSVRHDIPMVAGGSVSGRVVDDATGNGISGAEVMARTMTGLEFFGMGAPIKGVAGADGAFTIAAAAGKIMLFASAPGYLHPRDAGEPEERPGDVDAPDAPPDGRAEILEVASGAVVADKTLRLRRGVEIDVVVTNPDGVVLPGATVSWVKPNEDLGGMFGPKNIRSFVCDAAGKVRLKGLPARHGIVVAARHPDFPVGGQKKVDTVPLPERPITVVVERGASLAGTLLDPDGKPSHGLDLELHPDESEVARAFGEWTWAGRAAHVDADGKFLVENLPPGKLTISLGSPARELTQAESEICLDPSQATVTLTAGKREQIMLQLMRTLAISGMVLDAAGKPVGDASITVSRIAANVPEWDESMTQTAADGSYTLSNLVPGEYRLRVDGPQTSPDSRPDSQTRVARAGATRVDFKLTR